MYVVKQELKLKWVTEDGPWAVYNQKTGELTGVCATEEEAKALMQFSNKYYAWDDKQNDVISKVEILPDNG